MNSRSQEAPAECFRLFVAFSVPPAVGDEIERVQSELRRSVREAHIRWMTRGQFHLTLKFLGDVAAGRVAALVEALTGAVVGYGPLPMRAEGVGFFPSSHSPRVVWVGVKDAEEHLADLQRAVEEAVAPFTAEKPEGRFTGHVTVGRIKEIRRKDADALVGVAADIGGRVLGEWTADRLELIRSELTPSGARYSELAAVRLTS